MLKNSAIHFLRQGIYLADGQMKKTINEWAAGSAKASRPAEPADRTRPRCKQAAGDPKPKGVKVEHDQKVMQHVKGLFPKKK